MSTDSPKMAVGDESGSSPAAPAPTDAPPLSELQQAIVARARETIARRDAKPRKSRAQRLVAFAVAVAAALAIFSGINYLVAEAQRMLAEYAASKEVASDPPAPQASEDSGVIILQPDRTLMEPGEPVSPPPVEAPPAK